jgi:hypothetical protein
MKRRQPLAVAVFPVGSAPLGALIGRQVLRIAGRLKLGSEAVFAFLDYLPLPSSTRTDSTFRFPFMPWHFAARYAFY